MKYYFFAPDIGQCTVKLWARGAYGFSAPQKVEISTPGGRKASYSYRTLHEMPGVQLSPRTLMRIAIAHFLTDPIRCEENVALDSNMPLFEGRLHRPAPWPRTGPVGRLAAP